VRVLLSIICAVCTISVSTICTVSAIAAPEHKVKAASVKVVEEKIAGNIWTVGTADIACDRQTLWEILTDYKNAAKTFHNLSLSEVVDSKDAGLEAGQESGPTKKIKIHQIVKPGFFPFTFDYIVDLSETYPDKIAWTRASGAFSQYEGSWRIEPLPAAGEKAAGAEIPLTRVTYSVFLDANKFIPQWLMRRSLRGYMPEVFASVEAEAQRRRLAKAAK
jgi:hypothetical protein